MPVEQRRVARSGRPRSSRRAGCARSSAVGISRTTVAVDPAEARRSRRPRRPSSASSCMPRQMPRNGAPCSSTCSASALVEPARRAGCASRRGTRRRPGSTMRSARARSSGSSVTNGVGAALLERAARPSRGCTARSRRSRRAVTATLSRHVVVVDLRRGCRRRPRTSSPWRSVTNSRLFVNRSQTATNSSSVMSMLVEDLLERLRRGRSTGTCRRAAARARPRRRGAAGRGGRACRRGRSRGRSRTSGT